MDRRQKSSGITFTDIRNAIAAAKAPEPSKRSGMYWRVYRQIAWEHRKKIKAGLDAARAAGKRVGRPPVSAMGEKIAGMRNNGLTWKEISVKTRLSRTTAARRYVRYLTTKDLKRRPY